MKKKTKNTEMSVHDEKIVETNWKSGTQSQSSDNLCSQGILFYY